VCDGLGVKPDADTEEDVPGNSFVHQMVALGGLVREKIQGRLHHGVKRPMAVIRSRFEYDMGLIADGLISDLDRTDEENEAACLELIEAVEEPRGRLAKLFVVEVVPPVDNEGLWAKLGHEGKCNKLVSFSDLRCDSLRGPETFICRCILNVRFCLSLLFSFLLESYSCMFFLACGCTPWREGASGGTVAQRRK
jgi:hypothetical protein